MAQPLLVTPEDGASVVETKPIEGRRRERAMRRTIVVPLDGSPGSELALVPAAELARAHGATLRLLHVAPSPTAAVALDGLMLEYADQVAERIRHDVRAYLTSAAAAVSGMPAELVVRFGDPADEIVREARTDGVYLVLMATHRRSGLRRLLEGSVAEGVAAAASVPVLLVDHGQRQAVGESVGGGAAGRRIVRRRFWCAWGGRDVEVEFVERGLPALPWATAVRSCSAFDPPTAIECRRQCVDVAFRRQWAPALPIYSHR
jgi:nucleotide-binding universal stress UspA family protein